MRNKPIRTVAFCLVILIIGIVSMGIWYSSGSADTTMYYPVGKEHVPEGYELFSEGSMLKDDISHPLHTSDLVSDLAWWYPDEVYDYLNVSDLVVIVGRASILRYWYEYASDESASMAAQSMVTTLLENSSDGTVIESTDPPREGVVGPEYYLMRSIGEEKDEYLRWVVSTQGPYLQIVIVDGFGEDNVTSILNRVMESWFMSFDD